MGRICLFCSLQLILDESGDGQRGRRQGLVVRGSMANRERFVSVHCGRGFTCGLGFQRRSIITWRRAVLGFVTCGVFIWFFIIIIPAIVVFVVGIIPTEVTRSHVAFLHREAQEGSVV